MRWVTDTVVLITILTVIVGLQFSGSYVGEGADSETLELRIDWDPISEHAKGLHMLSGDVFTEKSGNYLSLSKIQYLNQQMVTLLRLLA